MRYWRYPGDYSGKTGHLSLAQHGAYTVLMDHQYATEAPLPSKISDLYRICRAQGAEEQTAVRAVVAQFFPLAEDGEGRWNPRCRQEIERAQPRILAAKQNGRKSSGRPPKTQRKPTGLELGLQNETRPEPSGTPSGKPTLVNQGKSKAKAVTDAAVTVEGEGAGGALVGGGDAGSGPVDWKPPSEVVRLIEQAHQVPTEFWQQLLPEFVAFWLITRRASPTSLASRFVSHCRASWEKARASAAKPAMRQRRYQGDEHSPADLG